MWHYLVRDEEGYYHETSGYFRDEEHLKKFYKGSLCTLLEKVEESGVMFNIEDNGI